MKKIHQQNCIFCAIIVGAEPCHKIWEDDNHLAFLSIYPNTPGATIVITKKHYPSDVFSLPGPIYAGLMEASRIVTAHLNKYFRDVGRTGMIVEGFGIDHAHAKLYPMHGTKMKRWRPILSDQPRFNEIYDGFLTSADGPRADDRTLEQIAARIRASIK